MGKETNVATLKLVQAIRSAGFSADRDYMDRKAKTQFRNASRLEAKVVITVGEEELEKEVVKLKVMKTGKEIEVPLVEIQNNFEKIFNKETADMTAYNEFFGKE